MDSVDRLGLKLNIGSGQRKFGEGWTNVDINPKWSPDVLADGSSMPMFEDNSADIIVLHHVLEHFGCGESDALLRECLRILKPIKPLLVFVPNMRQLAKGWIEGRIETQIFLTNVYGAYMNDEADRHKWGYTDVSLIGTLMHAGYDWVLKFNWREIPGADIARDWWVLGIEARKGE